MHHTALPYHALFHYLLCFVVQVGRQGVVTMEESKTAEDSLMFVEGMQFDRGYYSPYFVTDPERMVGQWPGAVGVSYHMYAIWTLRCVYVECAPVSIELALDLCRAEPNAVVLTPLEIPTSSSASLIPKQCQ